MCLNAICFKFPIQTSYLFLRLYLQLYKTALLICTNKKYKTIRITNSFYSQKPELTRKIVNETRRNPAVATQGQSRIVMVP